MDPFINKFFHPLGVVSQLFSDPQRAGYTGSHVTRLPAGDSQWKVLAGDWRVREKVKLDIYGSPLSVSGSFYSRALSPP